MVEFMISPTIKASAAKLKGFSTMLLLQLRVLLEEHHKLNQTMNLAFNHLNLGDQWKGFHSLTRSLSINITLHTQCVCVCVTGHLQSIPPFTTILIRFSVPCLKSSLMVSNQHYFFKFSIGIHSMQGSTATTRHGFTRKRSTERLKHTENLFTKNLQLIGVC